MSSSKTSRRALAVGGKKGGFQRAVGSPRFIPTGNGHFTYVFLPDGSSAHVKVASAAFADAVAALIEAEDGVFQSEMAANDEKFPGCGWDYIANADVDSDD